MRVLITNIGRLFTATAAGVLVDAALVVAGERITWVGSTGDRPPVEPDEVIDAGGALVTPGLIDAHAHPVYAGDRLAEISQRTAGASYEGVAAGGGGIPATVASTRATPLTELARTSQDRLAAWLASGTTTVEAKSGYHLEREGELGVIALLAGLSQHAGLVPRVEITFLGAHDVPSELAGRDRALGPFAEEVADWSAAAQQAGARFVDVFCDAGYFSIDDARKVLLAGQQAGLAARVHADELERTGASLLAAEVGAVSADHLLCATAEDATALAEAQVTATLCPLPALALGRMPPARLLAEHGVTLALGTDHNPGQSGVTSMSLVVGLAVHLFGLSVEEALLAATAGGAQSVSAPERGSLKPGQVADLVQWDAGHEGAFAWDLGMVPQRVWKGGLLVNGGSPNM